jgi:hypothetical protein
VDSVAAIAIALLPAICLPAKIARQRRRPRQRLFQKAFMFEFLVNRLCPLILVVAAVTLIDTPGNFFRKWMLEFIYQMEPGRIVKHLPF